jgi:hypothetical protein
LQGREAQRGLGPPPDVQPPLAAKVLPHHPGGVERAGIVVVARVAIPAMELLI